MKHQNDLDTLKEIPIDDLETFVKIREWKKEAIRLQRYEEANRLRDQEREMIEKHPLLNITYNPFRPLGHELKSYVIQRKRDETINQIINE